MNDLKHGHYYWLLLGGMGGKWRVGRYDAAFEKRGGFWVDATEQFIVLSESDTDSIKPESVGPRIGWGPEDLEGKVTALKEAWSEGYHPLNVGPALIAAVEDLIE